VLVHEVEQRTRYASPSEVRRPPYVGWGVGRGGVTTCSMEVERKEDWEREGEGEEASRESLWLLCSDAIVACKPERGSGVRE
jgi:hypothetical protein